MAAAREMRNRAVVITGAAGGLGTALAEYYAALGAKLALLDLDAARAETLAARLRAKGALAVAIGCDIADEGACSAAIADARRTLGGIDLLVNNAGIVRDNLLAMLDDADIRAVLDTNVLGVFHVTRAVVPHMISKRAGKIVNLGSVAGDKGGRGQSNYAASKGAIQAFTRAMAVELASRKITVNCVAPGVIDTEMSQAVRDLAGEQVTQRILLKRVGRADDVAHAVWFLASRFADYITGEVLHVDGGFKME